jgi:hypothetical protein
MGEFGNLKSQWSNTYFIFDPLLAATEQYLKPILGSESINMYTRGRIMLQRVNNRYTDKIHNCIKLFQINL